MHRVRPELELPRRPGLDQLAGRDRAVEPVGVAKHAHGAEPCGDDVVGERGELVQILETDAAERDLHDPHGELRQLEERPVVEAGELPDERFQESVSTVVEARRARREEVVEPAVPAFGEYGARLAENRCTLVEELEAGKQCAELRGVHLSEPGALENGHAFLKGPVEGEVETVRVGVRPAVGEEVPTAARLEVRVREVECSGDEHEVDRLLAPEREGEREEGGRHGQLLVREPRCDIGEPLGVRRHIPGGLDERPDPREDGIFLQSDPHLTQNLEDPANFGASDEGGEVDPGQWRDRLEQALFEIRRVIAGQDQMLERVLVCLLAQGHLLIEGVPGLAKTLTIKTTAGVLGGSFARVQFTPDLVPADLIGTRVYRPDQGTFETELGPVFCNFLLADEINRAPAKVQSALLEVMQEHQVTIAHTTYPVPDPFLVMATQNPIESEGTYPLPEAQIDRFMLKILIDYPEHDEELTIVQRQLTAPPELREALSIDELRELQRAVYDVYVDPSLVSYAVTVATGTRRPSGIGLPELDEYIEFGASPRGPIAITQASRALALVRGRDYVTAEDVKALAKDALRHRLVLSYQALAEGVSGDEILDKVLAAVAIPEVSLSRPSA
jgi:MoxR-like ATPase